jgi:hypothetical protein
MRRGLRSIYTRTIEYIMDISDNASASTTTKKQPKPPVKPVPERLREGVALLTKLQTLGIAATDPGYVAFKSRIDDWVKKDEAWTGSIDFPRWGRRAYVNLPTKYGCEATAVLKTWKFE